MFRGGWGHGFTLGLVIGIAATTLLLLTTQFATNEKYNAAHHIGEQHISHEAEGKKGKEVKDSLTYWSRRFLSLEDTLAQWLMMFFSLGAIVLLWLTLREANKTSAAAFEANQMARDDNRPWMDFSVEHFKLLGLRDTSGLYHLGPMPVVAAKNFGKSPALAVNVVGEIFEGELIQQGDVDRFVQRTIEEGRFIRYAAVFPDSEIVIENTAISTHHPKGFRIDEPEADKKTVWLVVAVLYRHYGDWRYTCKIYTCKLADLLPRPTVGQFTPMHFFPLDRYT